MPMIMPMVINKWIGGRKSDFNENIKMLGVQFLERKKNSLYLSMLLYLLSKN